MATTVPTSAAWNHSGAPGGTATANSEVKKVAALGLLRSVSRPVRKAPPARAGAAAAPPRASTMRSPMTIR